MDPLWRTPRGPSIYKDLRSRDSLVTSMPGMFGRPRRIVFFLGFSQLSDENLRGWYDYRMMG